MLPKNMESPTHDTEEHAKKQATRRQHFKDGVPVDENSEKDNDVSLDDYKEDETKNVDRLVPALDDSADGCSKKTVV
uniref:Uncharacterized protein n=1 Tax=Arundo donax TaxID=35708 RepID=A0A0A9FST7_ARUDO